MPGSGPAYGYNNGFIGKQSFGKGPRFSIGPKHRIDGTVARYESDVSVPPTYGLTSLSPSPLSSSGMWSLSEMSAFKTVGIWPGVVTTNLIFYVDWGVPRSFPYRRTTSWGNVSDLIQSDTVSSSVGDLMSTYTLSLYAGTNTTTVVGSQAPYYRLYLDGATSWISNDFTTNTGNNFTIIAWCKPTVSGPAAGGDIIGKNYNRSVGPPYASWGFEYLSTNQFRFAVADNLSYNPVTTTGTYATGNVYCVALTYGDNTSSKVVRGYINSNGTMTQDATITNAANPVYNTGKLWLGNVEDFGANYFTGDIYAFMVYTTCLTQSQLQQNFNVTRSRFRL